MPTDTVLSGLLSRQLDAWLPAALQRSRRATLALACGAGDAGTLTGALSQISRYADRLRGARLTVLVLADTDTSSGTGSGAGTNTGSGTGTGSDSGTDAGTDLAARLGAVEASLPAEVAVHLVPGDVTRLPVALKAAGAAGAPVFTLVVPPGPAGTPASVVVAAAATGRPAELLLVADASVRAGLAQRFPLVTEVELTSAEAGLSSAAAGVSRVVAFATSSDRALEAFKTALWAVGAEQPLRLRTLPAPADPRDPVPLTVSTEPEVGPLGRELLAELGRSGPRTVTELRRHALTGTVYRAADAVRALTELLATGAVRRDPEAGRLGGDVVIHAVGDAAAGSTA
ncbi:hypothetical protein [Micromonospora yangpuensis]|uniref:Uncharacterized protein n=1 Tax=Micromonospora yangpuensis TaxID=683228 RepID=A0A1C6UEL6_9ACTN|nr:hypothetical protein [Micromonospora yangpuensis]GGM06233.1 hypothetical protein GCM10012279_25110 [Micromonospora yangpuensis]SCL52487.1 hypothetical protein GA0070617_2089 [Micromonospora yangpuensis]